MYKKEETPLREKFLFNSAVTRSIDNLLNWTSWELPNWIEARFIYGTKTITRRECDALFEAEERLLEHFIKEGDTDNIYKLINLFYDPIKVETLSEREQIRSKKLQRKEFDLYVKAIDQQLESIALNKNSHPAVLKAIMERLFKDFEGNEQWNKTVTMLDDPLEEYLFREKMTEATLIGQDEYLVESKSGIPFE
jgi:hypothetical protein